MTTHGKTIRIYLADANPAGIRHAEILNWTGQAVVCPRVRVGEVAKWPESQRPGVYILFGTSDDNEPRAYVGEGESVITRLQNHVQHKDFWSEAVFFSSKDENLTKAHVKYLESRFVEIAKEAGRIELENGTVPSLPSLSRSDRDALEEFLGHAKLLLAALGFLIFQATPKKSEAAGGGTANATGPLADVRLHFSNSKINVAAEGASTDQGFVVFTGSRGPLEKMDHLSPGYSKLRDELIGDGSIQVDGETIVFAKDVAFNSSSAAAAIVCGGTRNGREVWKAADGRTLKSLEEELATTVPPEPSEAE